MFKFSMVMPNLNGEKYLEKAIQAFLNQNYDNKELIIVDSSSTDNSHSIIKMYADGNIIKWIKDKDTSLSDAINIGNRYCTGDFIGYLGSDDILLQNTFKKADELLQIMNNIDGFYFDYYVYYPDKNIQTTYKIPYKFNKENLLKRQNFIGLEDIFFKREIISKYKYNSKYKYAMDYDMYLQLLDQNELRMLYINHFATVNICDGNLSTASNNKGYEESLEIINKYSNDKIESNKAKTTLWQKLFSLKNEECHKVLTILGLKIKFLRRSKAKEKD